MKSSHLLKNQAMWFCSYPFGIGHHSAKSLRVLTSSRKFFIICLTGTLVGVISLLRCCSIVFVFSSRYWNTSFWVYIGRIWKAAWWHFNYQYACLRSIIAHSRSSKLVFGSLPTRRILPEKRFSKYIFTKLISNRSTRWCAISDRIWV